MYLLNFMLQRYSDVMFVTHVAKTDKKQLSGSVSRFDKLE